VPSIAMVAFSVFGACCFFFPVATLAQNALNASMREEIVFLKNNSIIPVSLETTIYRPEGAGPFPVAIINHGKSPGPPALQERARYQVIAREFVKRGYAVVIPMRQGFSKSGGVYVDGGCYIASNGRAQGDDLGAILARISELPWAKADQVVMIGQSHGGLSSMAYGEKPSPQVKGLINFAGGLRFNSGQCEASWRRELVNAFGEYGSKTKLPSIWFYGENDSFFEPAIVKEMHAAYAAGNPKAKLVAFGPFGADAHGLMGALNGRSIWLSETVDFLDSIGMPSKVLTNYLEKPSLPATSFAKVDDVAAVPFIRDNCKASYSRFVEAKEDKAFAISKNGACGFNIGFSNEERALANCKKNSSEQECKLYVVNDQMVWVNN
jgi:dienelactone hydrolase